MALGGGKRNIPDDLSAMEAVFLGATGTTRVILEMESELTTIVAMGREKMFLKLWDVCCLEWVRVPSWGVVVFIMKFGGRRWF